VEYLFFCTLRDYTKITALILDILFIITMVWSLYFGFVNGPIKVFLYIISLIVAVVAAMVFTPTVAQLLRETFVTQSPYMPFLALGLTFITVLSVMRLISNMLLSVAEGGYINSAVQGIGSILMVLIYAFFFSTLTTFFIAAKVIDADKMNEKSIFYKHIKEIPTYGKAFLKATTPFVDGFIDYINRSIAQLNDGGRRPNRFTQEQEANDSLQLNDTPMNFDLDSISVPPNKNNSPSPLQADTTQ
jgi:membrane protein required for colicin V production